MGRKVRARRKGGRERQAGNRYGAVTLTEKITGNGDGADEARHQRASANDGNNGATQPTQTVVGAAHGGGGDVVGGQCRGPAVSMSGAVAPVTLVVSAALSRGGEEGALGPRAFLSLMDSTQSTGLAPDFQGVASGTNGKNREERSHSTNNEMAGGEDGLLNQ